jgi:hypothetical protein
LKDFECLPREQARKAPHATNIEAKNGEAAEKTHARPPEADAAVQTDNQPLRATSPDHDASAYVKPLDSLDELPKAVSEQIRALIRDGGGPPKFRSRSEAVWRVTKELVRAGCTNEQVIAILTDDRFRISAHVRDQSNPQVYAKRQAKRARAEAEHPELAELNARYAVVSMGGRTVLKETADGRFDVLARRAFEDEYANRFMLALKGAKPKDISLGQWWFEHRRRRQYDRVDFLPGREAPEGVYNLWRGWTVQPKRGECGRYLKLVHDVIAAGNQEVSDYLLNWMALKVQQPWLKLETAIALKGPEGTGKSIFAERFGELFGSNFVKVTDRRGLMGNFNAHLEGALLVFSDEAAPASSNDMIGRLKTLITQTHVRIERKGIDSFEVPNFFSLIVASNNEHFVSVDVHDRRWLVLDVATDHRGDFSYFKELMAEWNEGGREALFHFLLERNISTFEHRIRPLTQAHT